MQTNKINYEANFAKDHMTGRWTVRVKAYGEETFPPEGAVILATRRNGTKGWVVLGKQTGSDIGTQRYEIEKNARIAPDLEGKAIASKLRFSNPRRYNSWGYKSFQIILNEGKLSVKDFLYRGGRVKDLRWDLARHRCEIVDSLEDDASADSPRAVDESGEEIIEDTATETPEEAPEEAPEGPRPEVPVYETTDKDEVLPETFQRIWELGLVGQNILLVGPSGSGKTFLAAKLAEKLGRPFAAQSCSAGMSESQLAGWLLPIGDSGKFAYVPSAFVTAYETGGVFLFDEADAADENTLIFVNAALAGDSFYLPQRFENPCVKRHPDFVAVAAANTFGLGEMGLYTGRTQLDGATLDRFRAGVVFVDYNPKVERKLVDPEVLRWGKMIRRVIDRNNLERIMSTRVLLDFTVQKQRLGYSIEDMEASYFADWTPDERNLVAQA